MNTQTPSPSPAPRFGWRSRLVGELAGDILEIGVGSGSNLPYYRRANGVWGIEPDAKRVEMARQYAQLSAIPMQIEQGVAESLPYEDGRFDHVVSSLVFCSVRDPRLTLAEVRRVLKPGGMLQMVEHIRPRTPLLAWLADRLTPWWSGVAHNCHLNRHTLEVLREEGWQVTVHRRLLMVVRVSAKNHPSA